MEVNMLQKAVIDRFEGKQAVLSIDEKLIIVLRTLLPENVKEGDWLQVEIKEGKLISAKVDLEEKALMTERIAKKLALLRAKAIKK